MALIEIIDQKNNPLGEIELSNSMTQTPLHKMALKQSVLYFLASKRGGNHSTKKRSEVAYSTKKLYRQKGTGNARVGSARSPIRRHGGVTFGPKPRNYSFRLNKKFKKLAFFSIISEKFRKKQILVMDKIDLVDYKTKNLKLILDNLGIKKVLIVDNKKNENLKLASRNIQGVTTISEKSLNVYELMRFQKQV